MGVLDTFLFFETRSQEFSRLFFFFYNAGVCHVDVLVSPGIEKIKHIKWPHLNAALKVYGIERLL